MLADHSLQILLDDALGFLEGEMPHLVLEVF